MVPEFSNRILYLISSKGFFGAENVVLQLAKESVTFGIKPFIGVFKNLKNPNVEVAQNAKKYNLPTEIFDCKGKFDVETIFKIRHYIKDNNVSIIHSHGYKSNFYGLLASINMDTKRIATCHNWLGDSPKMKFYKWLDKLLLNRFDKVVVVSDILKDEVLRSGIRKEKVEVIYNGIDIENFKLKNSDSQIGNSELRRELGIKEEEKVIGTVGRLTEEKGHIYLLKAAKKVIAEFPNIKFLIVGDGPLMKNLKFEVGSLKLENKVVFAGIRDDIPDMLGIMDVFVMPSLKEGMPMALLEAMAAGRPVIATNAGAIPKIIENDYSGILIEPKDEVKLSSTIIKLLKDKKQSKFLGKNAYEVVKSKFSAKKMAQSYIEILSTTLQKTKLIC